MVVAARKVLDVDQPIAPRWEETLESVVKGKFPASGLTFSDVDTWTEAFTEAELIAGQGVVQAARAVTKRSSQLLSATLSNRPTGDDGTPYIDLDQRLAEDAKSRACVQGLIAACSADIASMPKPD